MQFMSAWVFKLQAPYLCYVDFPTVYNSLLPFVIKLIHLLRCTGINTIIKTLLFASGLLKSICREKYSVQYWMTVIDTYETFCVAANF